MGLIILRKIIGNTGQILLLTIISTIQTTTLGRENNTGFLRTGYGYNPRFANYFQNSSETPDRVKWIHKQITKCNLDTLCDSIIPIDNPMEYVKQLHTAEHIKAINDIEIDSANGAIEKIADIAELAVAYALGATRDVCSGKIRNAFVNLRPPGHHVESNSQNIVGFCVYGNVPLAARYATEKFGIKRILIVDWDFHHGNGTVSFVGNDLNVLFVETGSYEIQYEEYNKIWKHIITKKVEGNNDNEDFLKIWDDVFVPKALKFRPELILISCGFDLKKNDGLGNFNVTAQGISMMTKKIMEIADSTCNGKVVSFLEGGYRDAGHGDAYHGLAECAENHLRTLMTSKIQPETPYFKETIVLKDNDPVKKRILPRINLGNLAALKKNYTTIKVLTLQGKTVVNNTIHTNALVPGLYVIDLIDKKGLRYTIPYVKK